MRYVIMVVVFGLLAVGAVAYAANAAPKQGVSDSRLIFGPARDSVARVAELAEKSQAERERAAQAAQAQQLQKQKELELKNREAVDRFGKWGPYLVEAAEMYGQDPGSLYRVMTCESKGDSNADNGVNKGLFQFHPGTWAGTPYGSASIYDGRAQIMAAAWMWSQGRRGEWGCK